MSLPPLKLDCEFCLGVDESDILFVGECVLLKLFKIFSSSEFPFVCLTGIFDWSIDRVENLSDNDDRDFLHLIGKLVGLELLIGEYSEIFLMSGIFSLCINSMPFFMDG